jgi:hypothetical protein
VSRLPQPLSATGRVTHDPVTRSLLVKPAENGWAALIGAGATRRSWMAVTLSAARRLFMLGWGIGMLAAVRP